MLFEVITSTRDTDGSTFKARYIVNAKSNHAAVEKLRGKRKRFQKAWIRKSHYNDVHALGLTKDAIPRSAEWTAITP